MTRNVRVSVSWSSGWTAQSRNVAASAGMYLKSGGRFGFVMPLATLTRGQRSWAWDVHPVAGAEREQG
jgi:hypothetical protein